MLAITVVRFVFQIILWWSLFGHYVRKDHSC